MKKIILTLVLLLTFTFCLAGCDGGNYWEITSANADEVFTSENFEDVFNIEFSSNLQTIMGQSSSYAELEDVLNPLFESAVYYSYMHYKDFLIVPQNKTSKFKNAIKQVDKNISKFKNDLSEFVDAKADYESYITFTSQEEATKDSELARLLLFKREYITVIESAYNLSESLFEARRAGYYDYSDYTSQEALADERADCSLAVNASNLEITKIAIKITRAYNAKQMASEYENYWQTAQSFHNNVVKEFENNSLTIASNAKEKLQVWQGVYNMFITECNTLNTVMKNIDVWQLAKCGNSASSYAQETGKEQDETMAAYYLNFYNNVELLKEYTLDIFA